MVDCEVPSGHVDNGLSCDDQDPEIHPDADEVCDEHLIDDDCDGLIDDDDPDLTEGIVTGWPDAAGDGLGDASVEPSPRCRISERWAGNDADCDDDARTHPGADDPFDGVDQNCDGFDGPWLLDDFEPTSGDERSIWGSIDGNAFTDTTSPGQGSTAMASA